LFRYYQRPKSYLAWHLENKGLAGLATAILSSLSKAWPNADRPTARQDTGQILNLKPGELVLVRPIEQILATLDANRRHKGLLWMNGMSRYCGTRQRVYKRVERIILEQTGQLRHLKDTVLLDGVICDGGQYGGCDRSCHFFWKEAWLKRIEKEDNDGSDHTG